MTTPAAVTETVYLLVGAALGPFSTVWEFATNAEVGAALDRGDGNGFSPLAAGTDYTVSSLTPLTAGGTVSLSAALVTGGVWPAGARLALFRKTPLGQPSSFGEALGFSPAASEAALDTVSREVEDVAAKAVRMMAVGYGEAGFQVDPVATRASMVAWWNADGTLGQKPLSEIQVPGPQGPAGAIGGNVMAVGLAINIPTMTIPAGCDLIQTSGYNQTGVGAARYARRAAPPNHPQPKYFESADGAWWLLTEQAYTPQMFGAVASGTLVPITAGDIAAHPDWIGTYTAGMGWDYVATQECIYACFAHKSSPGAVVWQPLGDGNANKRMFVPCGEYPIDQTLQLAATGIHIEFEARNGAVWQWVGGANGPCVNFDAISYGRIVNLTVHDFSGAAVLVNMDYTGIHSGLATQQLTIDSPVLVGGGAISHPSQIGWQISESGGNAQGDTIIFVNPIFDGFYVAGIYIGGDNALSIIILGGDFQFCPKDAVANLNGSFFAYGTSCQNQGAGFFSYPQNNQLTRGGADFHSYGAVGTEINAVFDIRSEALVGMVNNAKNGDCRNYAIAGVGPTAWFGPGGHWLLGSPLQGGAKHWVWMLVDDGMPDWFSPDATSHGGFSFTGAIAGNTLTLSPIGGPGTNPWTGETPWAGARINGTGVTAGTVLTSAVTVNPDGSGTATVNNPQAIAAEAMTSPAIIDLATATWTPGAFVGRLLWRRFGSNGFVEDTAIASNTASEIVCTGPLSEAPQVGAGLVKIGGIGGAVAPNWDAAPNGFTVTPGSVGQGFTTTAGSTTITCGAAITGNVTAGSSWVAIPDGDVFVHNGISWKQCLFAKVTAVNPGVSITVSRAPQVTATDLPGYFGPVVADNDLSWLPIDFDAFVGGRFQTVQAPYGRIRWGDQIERALMSRTDFIRDTANFAGAGLKFVQGPPQQQLMLAPNAAFSGALDLTSAIGTARAGLFLVSGDATFNFPLLSPFVRQEFDLLVKPTVAGHTATFGTNTAGLASQALGATANVVWRFQCIWIGDGVTGGSGVWFIAAAQGPFTLP